MASLTALLKLGIRMDGFTAVVMVIVVAFAVAVAVEAGAYEVLCTSLGGFEDWALSAATAATVAADVMVLTTVRLLRRPPARQKRCRWSKGAEEKEGVLRSAARSSGSF